MNFIAPANFAFAGLISLILLQYILRLRRKDRVVSSTLLWNSALRDLQANAPWQKLRSSLLMWLQIACLALLVFALARPSVKMMATGGQTIAIVMDASGSMAATDVSPSRFEQARREASRLVRGLASGDRAMVIAASARTQVLAPLTSDKNVLQRAIANASTEDTSCNLRDAIVLASSLLGDKKDGSPAAKNPQIYVLSDGAVPPLQDLSSNKVGLQFVKFGRANDNLAITAMDIRRDYSEDSPYQIFATVHNYGTQPKTIQLELSHDGDLLAVRPLTIAAGGEQSQLFNNGNFSQGLFSVGFDASDDLRSDNVAYAMLAPPRALRVLLISPGNLFLEKALDVDPQVHLFRTTAADYARSGAAGSYDVIVCDGEAPATLPAGNQLLFHTFTSLAPVIKGTGVEDSPSAVDWEKRHPVTRFAPWNDIRFADTLAVTLKPWGQSLVDAERTPLVVAGERGGLRVVWCGFDLRDTDLPLKVTFPIFINNALHWLASGQSGSAQGAESLRAGDSVSLEVPATARQVDIQKPGGGTDRLAVDATPLLYTGARQVGIYTATAGDWKSRFAVSLLSGTESDLQPRDALKTQNGGSVGAEGHARANRELWGTIALACLALLGLEWWVFHRGI